MLISFTLLKMYVLKNRGQVALEYILLLSLSVFIVLMMVRILVGADPENPGLIYRVWLDLLEIIGSDKPDDIDR